MVYLPSLSKSYPAGVNPAKHIPASSEATPNETPVLTPQPTNPDTLPTLPSSTIERNTEELKHIWRGDDRDWARCHGALRSLARDGRKLELWRHWIGPDGKPAATRRQVMWTGEPSKLLNGSHTAQVYELIADAPFEVDITRAPVEFIRPVLEAHVGPSTRACALAHHTRVFPGQGNCIIIYVPRFARALYGYTSGRWIAGLYTCFSQLGRLLEPSQAQRGITAAAPYIMIALWYSVWISVHCSTLLYFMLSACCFWYDISRMRSGKREETQKRTLTR